MNSIIDAAISRSRMVLLALILILIAGLSTYISIPKEAEPEITIPYIYVSMAHEGISPRDAEQLLIRVMEKELQSIDGVKEMKSTASFGYAAIVLEFETGIDPDQALIDVREKVDSAKADLPDDTEEPHVQEINTTDFPVMIVTLSGDLPDRTLYRLARELSDGIETIPTVLDSRIVGDREEVLEVIVEPLKLESYNISPHELLNTVNLNNRLIAAGGLDTGKGRFAIKVPGLFETAKDVLDLPIKVSGDGNGVVTLRDLTTVKRTFKDPLSFARLNGKNAVALEVTKRAGTNLIQNNLSVRFLVNKIAKQWPNSVEITYSQDKMRFIKLMLTDLQNNITSAIILVMILVVGALGLRSGLLVGVAIPGSFLFGILILSILGLTLNMVVMFALILAVGMLVDGAIVVTEFADRRMCEGLSKKEAYSAAAKRMAWPITASTATTLAAFTPLLLWPGIVGEFMKFLPITLIATLCGSLLMALIFLPTLGAYFGKPSSLNKKTLKNIEATEKGDIYSVRGGTGLYIKFLKQCIKRPFTVLFISILLLFAVMKSYSEYGKGIIFFPEVDPDTARVVIHARGNLSVFEKDTIVQKVENLVLKIPDIKTAYTNSGKPAQGSNDSADVIGSIFVEFEDWKNRNINGKQILQKIRETTYDLPGIIVEVSEPEAGPPTGKAIRIQLTSNDTTALENSVIIINNALKDLSGLVDLQDTRPIPGIEWRLSINRSEAGRYGTDVVSIGNVVKLVTNGIRVGGYRPDDAKEEVDIFVRFPEEFRNLNMIDQLRVLTTNGQVPIGNFVKRTAEKQLGNITRINTNRTLSVESEVLPGVLADEKVKEIKNILKNTKIPNNVQITFRGQDEEQKAAAKFLTKAFIVALFIMAIILVTQFNSFYHALLILTAVILSTIGVMIGLLIMKHPFSIVMTGVGIITLAGIVVNNNIVLIDTFKILIKNGVEPFEAILRTGAQRLRPVLLTAITTIIGLLPMVTRINIDFATREITFGGPSTDWWVLLATAVAFGLAFATILTLVVTPSLLALGENSNRFFNKLFAKDKKIKQPA